MSLAKRINKDCIQAAEQNSGFEAPECELVRGRHINVKKLHKLGKRAVLKYWCDTESLGGSALWESGYIAELQDLDSIDALNKFWEKFHL